jgi:hypothetical protein
MNLRVAIHFVRRARKRRRRSNTFHLRLNEGATDAPIRATLGAGMNSAGDPGTMAINQ